jgi:hypothetical protein
MIEKVIRITDCGAQWKAALEMRMATEAECQSGECDPNIPAVVITITSGETSIVSIEDLYNALEQLAK